MCGLLRQNPEVLRLISAVHGVQSGLTRTNVYFV